MIFTLLNWINYINPGYGLSLVDTLWNASSYRQPLEQEGNPMTWIEKFGLQIPLIVAKKSQTLPQSHQYQDAFI